MGKLPYGFSACFSTFILGGTWKNMETTIHEIHMFYKQKYMKLNEMSNVLKKSWTYIQEMSNVHQTNAWTYMNNVHPQKNMNLQDMSNADQRK